MNAFKDQRICARANIPPLLLAAGKEMMKDQLYARLEELRAQGSRLPEAIERNAVAWALADLVRAGVIARSSGQPTVRLMPQVRKRDPAHEERIKKRAPQRARACIARARKEALPFDEAIVAAAAHEIERQEFRCAVSGIPFDIDHIGEGAGGSHYAPSPDRIVPALGYVAGNIRWVLWMVNRAKARMTDQHLLDMCRAVARTQPPA